MLYWARPANAKASIAFPTPSRKAFADDMEAFFGFSGGIPRIKAIQDLSDELF